MTDLDPHIEDLTIAIDARTHGAGFAPEQIPDAAEFFLGWAADRGLVGDGPPVVHILTDRWHGSTAVRAATAGLLDAQMVARRLAASRVRAPGVGDDWATSRDAAGQVTHTWRATIGDRPAGEFTITVTPIS